MRLLAPRRVSAQPGRTLRRLPSATTWSLHRFMVAGAFLYVMSGYTYFGFWPAKDECGTYPKLLSTNSVLTESIKRITLVITGIVSGATRKRGADGSARATTTGQPRVYRGHGDVLCPI